jgi:hypothetical protein
MNHDDRPNPLDPDDLAPPADLPRAALLRAYADGEHWAVERINAQGGPDTLSAEESRQVAFERALRERVGAHLTQHSLTPAQQPPAGLRDAIAAAMASAHIDDIDDTDAADVGADADAELPQHAQPAIGDPGLRLAGSRADATATQPAPRPGVLGRLAPVAAVAAVLLLAAALFFNALNQSVAGPWDAAQLQQVSTFITNEHDRIAAFDDPYQRKFGGACSIDTARERVAAKLGASPDWFNARVDALLDQGYTLAGASNCAVPGGPSVHLVFKPKPGVSLEPVSVFLQADPDPDFVAGLCYECPASKAADAPINIWKDNGLLIYIHANSGRASNLACDAFEAPTRRTPLG